jgi:hypothetical protein
LWLLVILPWVLLLLVAILLLRVVLRWTRLWLAVLLLLAVILWLPVAAIQWQQLCR